MIRGTTLIDLRLQARSFTVNAGLRPGLLRGAVPPGGSGANFGCCFRRKGLSLLPSPSLFVRCSVLFSVNAFRLFIIHPNPPFVKFP